VQRQSAPTMRPFRPSRGKLVLLTLWAAGVGVVCWFIPTGPRDGWQPAPDDHVCGLLHDGKTIVVCKLIRRQTDTETSLYGGPVLLRDIETGAILANHFSAADQFDEIRADWFTDVLHIGHRVPAMDKYHSQVVLYDPRSGRELTELNRSALYRTTYWECSPDGRLAAACGTDKEGRHRVAICDKATGKRLYDFPDCYNGRFSWDGRRIVADSLKPTEVLVFDIATVCPKT
jgi:hypothetical protein